MVCGMKTCEEKYKWWTYVQMYHKDVGIYAPKSTKMSCKKWNVDANISLKKAHTSGVLSKDNEIHQVDTSLDPRRL